MNFKPLTIRIDKHTLLSITEPEQEFVSVRDISRVLSKIPRFNGHGVGTRSIPVGEHSINVAFKVRSYCRAMVYGNTLTKTLMLAGLLHDGHEYIIGDMATPVKNHVGRAHIYNIVAPMDEAIAAHIGIEPSYFHHPAIKWADRKMLEVECEWLFEGEYFDDAESDLQILAAKRPLVHKTGLLRRKPKVGLNFAEADAAFWAAFEYICELPND